jgi:uncharacterized iron-regulated protein
MSTPTPFVRLALVSLLFTACSSVGLRGAGYMTYDTKSGRSVELGSLCDELARHDVVFLGEEHDNDVGHRLQLWTLTRLFELRPGLVLSMEQFEADVQELLDRYLAGKIGEEEFLATSRPWGNYAEHYRPMVEFARRHGIPVIAANIPRPLARRVAYGGLERIGGENFGPWDAWTDEPEYLDLFAEAMGRHGQENRDEGLKRWFAAQCSKDEKMAESIAAVFDRENGERPLVVHLCGKFHSDKHLGSVSRLARHKPELSLAVVSMNSDKRIRRALSADELSRGDFVWLVRPQPD